MSDNKSSIDKFFDLADQALTPLEKALSTKNDSVIDVESEDKTNEWEKLWEKEIFWAVTNGGIEEAWAVWHAFPSESCIAKCGQEFKSHHVKDRKKLEHGTKIIACTSCIIAVSQQA